jgi:hypothetical protein
MEKIISLSEQLDSSPTNENIVQMECHMYRYLKQLKTDQAHTEMGYSQRLPRFKIKGNTTKETLRHLEKYYWALYRRANSAKKMCDMTRDCMEKECEHEWEKDWSNRDERSRYQCKHCNKGR